MPYGCEYLMPLALLLPCVVVYLFAGKGFAETECD